MEVWEEIVKIENQIERPEAVVKGEHDDENEA